MKYFNTRLLHYSGRFATNSEYLFFTQFVLEQKKVADSINIALKKIHGQPITAPQTKSDVDKLKNMRQILGTHHPIGKNSCTNGCNGKTTWYSNMVYDIVKC